MTAPFPYCGQPAIPDDLAFRWNFDPVLLAFLAAALTVHWRFAGAERRPLAFAASWSLVALIFISPFCALASALFTARAVHHVLLIAFIPPLLIFAAPCMRAAAVHPVALGLYAVLHAVILWAWHVPSAYAAALADTRVYWLMQGTLFGSATLLWRAALATDDLFAGKVVLAFTFMQTALLGALISFATRPLYAFHLSTTDAWGLSALADQQLAGALMWTLGGAPYLAAALMGFYRLTTPRTVAA